LRDDYALAQTSSQPGRDDLSLRPEVRTLARRADKLAWLREQRDQSWPAGFALSARALILAGLPVRPTKNTKVTRQTRLGDGSTMYVTFTAAGRNVPLPYGADTNLLHFLVDRAADREDPSPLIEWKSAADYFAFIGVTDAGPNLRDLRDRWRRICGLAIQLAYSAQDLDGQAISNLFVVETAYLPKSINIPLHKRRQRRIPGLAYGVRLGQHFFKNIACQPVPVPKDLLRAFRSEPLAQRIAVFLGYRSFATRTESVIPWDDLQSIVGSDDKNLRKFRMRVRQSLEAIRVFWPEVNAELSSRGLLVGPPNHSVQLLPDAARLHRG
jgi:hypothetical protein